MERSALTGIQGSFAVVWKAIERISGKTVAIKQIKKHASRTAKAAIQKEVDIMEKLSHVCLWDPTFIFFSSEFTSSIFYLCHLRADSLTVVGQYCQLPRTFRG
jgi:serine/threonine protein kinase